MTPVLELRCAAATSGRPCGRLVGSIETRDQRALYNALHIDGIATCRRHGELVVRAADVRSAIKRGARVVPVRVRRRYMGPPMGPSAIEPRGDIGAASSGGE